MSLFFRVSGIVLTLMVFLGCGVEIGIKRTPPPIFETGRFRIIDVQTHEAFDTVTGQVCLMLKLPNGYTAKGPLPDCADLSSNQEAGNTTEDSRAMSSAGKSMKLPPGAVLVQEK